MSEKELQNAVPNNEPTEKEVKEAEKKGAIDKKVNNIVKDTDKAKFEQMLKDAKLPIEVENKDFKMGEGEVDVRKLNEENYRQLMFRLAVITSARLQNIDTTLLDILRLFMIYLKKHGIKDITKELDNLYEDLAKEINTKTVTK